MILNPFKKQKEEMIQKQLIQNGIDDEKVINAFYAIERHFFVDEAFQSQAYKNDALPIAASQTISQPLMVARMTQLLELVGNEKVLEIGTGSGFQAAILAHIGCQVFSIERHAKLLNQAQKRFQQFRLIINTMIGDGTLGWPQASPFDRIIVTAASPSIPESLINQLADNGIMLIPVGDRNDQDLIKIKKTNNKLSQETIAQCKFVPLIGREGWNN